MVWVTVCACDAEAPRWSSMGVPKSEHYSSIDCTFSSPLSSPEPCLLQLVNPGADRDRLQRAAGEPEIRFEDCNPQVGGSVTCSESGGDPAPLVLALDDAPDDLVARRVTATGIHGQHPSKWCLTRDSRSPSQSHHWAVLRRSCPTAPEIGDRGTLPPLVVKRPLITSHWVRFAPHPTLRRAR